MYNLKKKERLSEGRNEYRDNRLGRVGGGGQGEPKTNERNA